VERALDHQPPLPSEALAEGELLHGNLPPYLQEEFSLAHGGAFELYSLKHQFKALFDDNNDGDVTADEILLTAKNIGDSVRQTHTHNPRPLEFLPFLLPATVIPVRPKARQFEVGAGGHRWYLGKEE
jgi:hypothetical protein